MSRVLFLGLLGLLSVQPAVVGIARADGQLPPAAKRKVDFVKDIRPILQKHCVGCHGAKKQESGLRLDIGDKARDGGDRGVVFEAGKSAESLLIRYTAGLDPDITMPPEGDLLSKQQVGLLRAWIDQGADWPKSADGIVEAASHWAYRPLKSPAVPRVKQNRLVRNPVDAFVLDRLEKLNLEPSPPADRYTLIRRLSLDLLGLPPTPAEVDAFLGDRSPGAYAKLVDRLLKSPHFGERWGRHWLDKARYADSDGYEKDRPRLNAWRWRDWVIDAVNRDLPFDRFTIEQIAGDLLPAAGEHQLLATAFHRQTLTNTEGGTDKEQWRIEAVFDRVDTTGTVWLGLTVGCAKCHSHKYDAIPQREYYQLFAVYNNGDEVSTDVSVSEEAQARHLEELAKHKARITVVDRKLSAARAGLAPALKKWIEKQRGELAAIAKDPLRTVSLDKPRVAGPDGVTFAARKDGSWIVGGARPDRGTYTLTGQVSLPALTGLRIEVLADKALPKSGPGRADNGNFVLSGLKVELSADEAFSRSRTVTFKRAEADFSQKNWPVAAAINGKPETGWAVSPQFGKNHVASFYTAEPIEIDGSRFVRVTLDQQHGSVHMLGRFRVTALTGSHPSSALPKPVQEAIVAEKPGDAQRKLLADHYATIDKTTAGLLKQLAELAGKTPKPPRMSVRVVRQRTQNPRTTHVLRRGDFLQPQTDTVIEPAALSVLPRLTSRRKGQPADRLDLARWLVADDNPLSPRVAANHVWSHLFGVGLVRTINDFGVRGERPTHSDLLNWLATEYRRLKWSRKALIRTIVISATYRQRSRHRPELSDRDPLNRLLARQNRLRVEAEIIRDVTLAASGLLTPRIGGPSVFPPMPADVAALSYANNFKWSTSKGNDRFRRGLYTFFKRTAPHPNLVTFDCPDSNTTCVERRSSNTPLQALTVLNNEVFIEASQALARRAVTEQAGSDSDRLTHAFRLCVARPPVADELSSFGELLAAARSWYAGHAEDAAKLAGGNRPKDMPVAEAAAWVATCRIMLNMDEFITRE